jgi:hypothetical protein
MWAMIWCSTPLWEKVRGRAQKRAAYRAFRSRTDAVARGVGWQQGRPMDSRGMQRESGFAGAVRVEVAASSCHPACARVSCTRRPAGGSGSVGLWNQTAH